MVAINRVWTVGQLAGEYRLSQYHVRKAVDSLGVPLERCGQIRMIPDKLRPAVEAELQRQGILPKPEAVAR